MFRKSRHAYIIFNYSSTLEDNCPPSWIMGQVLGIINGSNRLHMLVELRVQHCKEMYQDSFENYELFLRFQIVQRER